MAGDGMNRREMLALLGGMALLLLAGGTEASPIDTSETMYTLPEDIKFVGQDGAPPRSVESAFLYSDPGGRALLRAVTLASGIHECAAQLRDGSTVRGDIGYVGD